MSLSENNDSNTTMEYRANILEVMDSFIEIENEFGLVLAILLIALLIISSIWLISGIRQYMSISSWSKRYNEYKKEKQDMDRRIAIEYGFGSSPTLDQ